MKRACLDMLLIIFIGISFIACSDKTDESSTQHQIHSSIALEGEDNLHLLMKKILTYYQPLKTSLESLLPQNLEETHKHKFMPVEDKKNEVTQLLWHAFEQNQSHQIEIATLEKALGLMQEWSVLCASAKPYMQIPLLEKYDTQIAIALSLLFLNNNKGDSTTLNSLLEGQYQDAKNSGELSTIIESQIQVRLLALYGLYHLDSINQSMEHLASHKVRMSLERDLEQYKDFLVAEHYTLYQKALALLKNEILKHQAPIDKIFTKILQYPHYSDPSLIDRDDVYLHIERITNAYELLKTHNIRSPLAQEIINIAQNPLKNVYSETLMTHYLYGLDYLSLALLGENIQGNLPLALEYLQQDFHTFQITQHRFDAPLFQNYMASFIIGAYILAHFYENEAYFDELLRSAKTELAHYRDVMSSDDIENYEDALFLLDKTDRSKFLSINLADSKPTDEAGYIKVQLILSPQEIAQINSLIAKEKESLEQGTKMCLTPLEAKFMLSLTYQAYKTQGFEGVAPEMFRIRLGEVFDINSIYNTPLARHLIDFDFFMLLGVADKQCYAQNEDINNVLTTLEAKENICGYNVYFDKENGFMTDKILPSQILEQTADGNIYYRINIADMNLNAFIFRNDEIALQALKDSQDIGELLPTLLAFFPYIKDYLDNRISSNGAQILLDKAKLKPCKIENDTSHFSYYQ